MSFQIELGCSYVQIQKPNSLNTEKQSTYVVYVNMKIYRKSTRGFVLIPFIHIWIYSFTHAYSLARCYFSSKIPNNS